MAVHQKLWLRINTLSIMTNCQEISVDEDSLIMPLSEEEYDQGSDSLHTKKRIPVPINRLVPTAE